MDYTLFPTVCGTFGFVAKQGRLLASFLPESAGRLRKRLLGEWPDAVEHPDALPAFRRQVEAYFMGKRSTFSAKSIKIDLSRFTPFQQAVLEVCRNIPHGQTACYADLARAVGRPGAARAVGSTMARNPLPLIIPCHRVLRADGSIGGFSSPEGIAEKKRMLLLEQDDRTSAVRRRGTTARLVQRV